MFDWFNNIYHSLLHWLTGTPTLAQLEGANPINTHDLDYLDLDDDFFRECKVLTDHQISDQLSQSVPNLPTPVDQTDLKTHAQHVIQNIP